ncbi:glutamyl-tRNA amidotransferase, subunit A [Daedalea quercina L-15889]|uniref:Glutamyl-tRNA amidotransferase, subunit A n=1 Tax=Daedalea quercina L-15889 TaxID=1314783 RepID=A0A165SPP7_9APHY|nr:glutamyl-tRNA amidotransferase, subunit A [Daedalea quercina L-15889]
MARILLACTILAPIAVAQQASFQLTGKTFTLAGIPYFAPPAPVSQFSSDAVNEIVSQLGENNTLDGLSAFSVLPSPEYEFADSHLEAALQTWRTKDDVWSEAFLNGLYIAYNGTHDWPTSLVSPETQTRYAMHFLLHSGNRSVGAALTRELPAGPYLLDLSSGSVFEVYRLYNDEQQSFLYGTIPNPSGGYTILSAKIPGAATESIGVPSRLYFTPTAEKPLAGLRFAVKDIYDVEGLRTGCGNRAYWELYPPRNQTAPAVQRLLDGGLVLVGKTKSSQFANGEVATDDWVDLHAPYNPRGDGYQDGSSSSTGSGTAEAAYPWLDYAIGSDTGGSMRGPAGVNGIFGNRPSHGAVSLDDVMPLSPPLDTAGIFARDANMWATAGHWWYQNFTSYSGFPKKLLFPVDFFGSSFLTDPPPAGTADAIFNAFITKLESFLGITRTEMNLTSLWAENPLFIAHGPLSEMLMTTYPTLITMDQTELVAEPFMADYAAVNNGRKPFIDPAPLTRWTYGWSLPSDAYAEQIANKTTFMNWFASEVVVGGDLTSCSESIFLYPQSSGYTTYRNAYTGPPSTPFGFSAGRIAVFAETPDMVVPVGEVPYNSTITGTTEYLPVTLSFIVAKDCDLVLFDLFAVLQNADIIKPVVTGSRIYDDVPVEE